MHTMVLAVDKSFESFAFKKPANGCVELNAFIDGAHGKPYCCRRPICSTSQSRVIPHFPRHIANSLLFITRFISLVPAIPTRLDLAAAAKEIGRKPENR